MARLIRFIRAIWKSPDGLHSSLQLTSFCLCRRGVAPHKVDREVTSALHRYAMLALATSTDSRLSVSTFELDGPGGSIPLIRLYHFRSSFGESADLVLCDGR